MANFFKKLGKAVASPVKGVVSIAKNPKKGLRNLGKSFEQVDDIVLPVLGFMAAGPAGAAAGSALAEGIGGGRPDLGKVALKGAMGYAGGAALQGLGGFSGAASKLGGLAKGAGSMALKGGSGLLKLGKGVGGMALNTLKNNQGGFDLGKLASLGLTAASLKGSRDETKAARGFNSENAAMRAALMQKLGQSPDYSALMERIMSRPNYSF